LKLQNFPKLHLNSHLKQNVTFIHKNEGLNFYYKQNLADIRLKYFFKWREMQKGFKLFGLKHFIASRSNLF
jgi:hypothetical protein